MDQATQHAASDMISQSTCYRRRTSCTVHRTAKNIDGSAFSCSFDSRHAVLFLARTHTPRGPVQASNLTALCRAVVPALRAVLQGRRRATLIGCQSGSRDSAVPALVGSWWA